MSKSVVVVALALVAILAGSSCGTCTKRCLAQQSLTFQDASGAPLTPLEVTEGNDTFRCADAADGGMNFLPTTCAGSVFQYVTPPRGARRIRAVATTGQLFEGDISPALTGRPPSANNCDCGDQAFEPLTITLK